MLATLCDIFFCYLQTNNLTRFFFLINNQVGLNTEYGYARSLARYAANLGPVAWRLAEKRIETVLPTGTEFGPGWVGEKPEAPPPQTQKCWNDLAAEHHSSRIMSPTTSVIGNTRSSYESKETAPAARLLKSEINPESNGLIRGCREVNRNPNYMMETALLPNIKKELNRFQPDLNSKLVVSPNSPVSNHRAGSSQQHPDLALQL